MNQNTIREGRSEKNPNFFRGSNFLTLNLYKTRTSLLLLAFLASGLSNLNAVESTSSTTDSDTKKTVIKDTNNPFEAQQKRIAKALDAVKKARRRSAKRTATEQLEREQDQLKKMLKKETDPLVQKEKELNYRLTYYKSKNSSKTTSIEKELEKVQADIKNLETLAAIDKWCKAPEKDSKTDDDKKKSSEKKRRRHS